MDMLIQPKFVSLSELLSKRLFKIPQYQRSYSWESKHRQDMFEDITSLRNQPDRRHFMATIVGLNRKRIVIVTDEYSVVEVVDGQQRLTTLIILLKAIQIYLSGASRLADKLQEILIKEDDYSLILLQMNHDPNGYFAEYLRNGEAPPTSKAATLADKALLSAIHECTTFIEKWCGYKYTPLLTEDNINKLIELTGLVQNRLTFIFHEIDDEATVYSVFEVLNSRGLPVPWLDRLKSLLMGIAFEHGSGNRDQTISELHQIWEGIYSTIGLRQGLSTEALRFAATLKSTDQRSKALGEEDAVESLVSQCDADPLKAIATSRWVLHVAKVVEDVLTSSNRSKAVTRIAHARLLAVAIGLSRFTDGQKVSLLALWEKISFRVFGLCRKDARTQVGEYVRLAWDCINTPISFAEINERLSAIGSSDREHSVDWAVETIQNTNCYDGWEEELRYLMYRYDEAHGQADLTNEQWNRIWEVSPSNSIEHVLPQQSQRKFVHRLGNLMLLPPGLNSKLSARKPIDKISEYRATGLYAASEVANMIESVGGWMAPQIDQREKKILEWVRATWA